MRNTRSFWVALGATLVVVRGAGAQGGAGLVQGTVQAAESGLPAQSVNVVVVGTRFGSLTQADGRYKIADVPPGTYQVRATRIGYMAREQAVTVSPGQTATADFQLSATAISLERVVTVGYGTQSSREVTGSVSSVTSSDIATMPVPRVDEAISGLVSGVQVQTSRSSSSTE